MPGRPMTEEQKRKKRERERQNGTPVIAYIKVGGRSYSTNSFLGH